MTDKKNSDSSLCVPLIALIWLLLGISIGASAFQVNQWMFGIIALIIGVVPPGYFFYTKLRHVKAELPMRGFKIPHYTPTHRIAPIKENEE